MAADSIRAVVFNDGNYQGPRPVNDENTLNAMLVATMGFAILAGLSLISEDAASSENVSASGLERANDGLPDSDVYRLAAVSGTEIIRRSGLPEVEDFVAALPSVAMVILGLVLFYRLARMSRIQTHAKKGDSDKWL